MIQLEKISKSFTAAPALQAFDLTVEDGITTVLIGPSGSGKSTILRLIVGLTRADRGHIFFKGEEILSGSLNAVRMNIGYVIQEGGLFPHLTAGDNVTLMARYLGWERPRIEIRLAELAELTRFPLRGLDRFPVQLSGGERQRVSLMRALMLDPDLLLLDEPLGALDPMIRADLQTDLQQIFKTLRKTVLLVTHDMGEACFFGDRVVLLHEGRIVQQGPPDALLGSPADPFVTRFINAQRTLVNQMGGRGR